MATKILAAIFGMVVIVAAYMAIAFFWTLQFWPRWLPWPGRNG